VFIGHGRSDAHAIANAIRTAAQAVERGMLEALAASVGETRAEGGALSG
jgi:fatty acid/phospholipid biosynthesis enzyme